MAQTDKTKKELIEEIKLLQKRIAELEIFGSKCKQQQQQQQQQQQNMKRLATVMHDSNDAITIQDFEGNIITWNSGAKLMYGYSKQEALQMNIGHLTPPDKAAEQKEFVRRLIAGEALKSFETQRVTKDGRILDVWLTVTRVTDDTGKPVGIASTERDITERKQAEETLKECERRWSLTFNAISSSICLIAPDGKILNCNQVTGKLLGKPIGELLGQFCYKVVHGSSQPIADCPTERMKKTKRKESQIIQLGERWLEVTVEPILDKNKCLLASVHIITDITERRNADEKEKKYLNELEIYYKTTFGREKRIIELKKEVEKLKGDSGK
jgi:PAS domain S-box-containing protein